MNSTITKTLTILDDIRQGLEPTCPEGQVFEKLVQPLFQELGWEIGREIEDNDDIGLVMPLITNSHPLVLLKPLALRFQELPRDHLSNLLGHAYNRNADWAIVTNFDRLGVYQTRWLSAHTKALSSMELGKDIFISQPDRLSILTPDSIATGHTTDIIGAKDRDTLLPVHELLFRHFQRWRQELIAYGSESGKIDLLELDSEIQYFFNQLIFLRSLEDTNRLHDKTLRSIYQTWSSAPPSISLKKTIKNLLDSLQKNTSSDLFKWSELLDSVLTDPILQGIIEGLYRAGLTVPIDFKLINADILGGMYEHFLSFAARQKTEAELRAMVQSPRLIPSAPITVADVRKEKGIYYTPPSLAEYTTSVACDTWYAMKSKEEIKLPRVLDFACGSGTFLVETLQYLRKMIPVFKHPSISEDELVLKIINELHGIDISSIAVGDTIANILHASGLPLETLTILHQNIRIGNALINKEDKSLSKYFGTGWKQQKPVDWNEIGSTHKTSGKFDIILANPPFKSTEQMQHGPERQYLEDNYVTAQGRWDQAFLFLELALRLISKDGVIGLVMPASVLKSESGARVRKIVEEHNALFQVVDFTDRLVFSGVSTYVTLIFLKINWGGKTKFIEIQDFPASETSRSWFFQYLLRDKNPPGFQVAITESDKSVLKGAPWIILNNQEQQLKEHIEKRAQEFPISYTIDQGIKTGLNEAFLVEEITRDESGFVVVRTYKGIRTVESKYLFPAVLGENISRYSLVPGSRRIIYPYSNDGNIVPETELRTNGQLWKYLQEWEEELSSRKSLKEQSSPWYSLIRPRGSWIQNPKILGPDYAQQSSFAFDAEGLVIPIGGNAIVSTSIDLRVILGILNSSLINWYITRGSVRRRGAYYAFYGRYLHRLPLLNVSKLHNGEELQRLIIERVDALIRIYMNISSKSRSNLQTAKLAAEATAINKELDELIFNIYEAFEYRNMIWGIS